LSQVGRIERKGGTSRRGVCWEKRRDSDSPSDQVPPEALEEKGRKHATARKGGNIGSGTNRTNEKWEGTLKRDLWQGRRKKENPCPTRGVLCGKEKGKGSGSMKSPERKKKISARKYTPRP